MAYFGVPISNIFLDIFVLTYTHSYSLSYSQRTLYFCKVFAQIPDGRQQKYRNNKRGELQGNHRKPEKSVSRVYSRASLVIFPTREKARGTANYFPVVRPVTPPRYITGDPSKFPTGETSVLYSRTDGVSYV